MRPKRAPTGAEQKKAHKMLSIAGKIRQLRQSGKTFKEISQELGVSISKIKNSLSKKQKLYGECARKARYTSLELAEEEALRIKKLKNQEIHTYNCPHCHGYHIASRKPTEEPCKCTSQS